jgi:aconitate hydratase
MYLGVKAVLAKSFARIHKANLINFGIIPLEFANPEDYAKGHPAGKLVIEDIVDTLRGEGDTILARIDGDSIRLKITLTRRFRNILICGGLLNYVKSVVSSIRT